MSSSSGVPDAARLVWGTAGIGQRYGLPDAGGVLSSCPDDGQLASLVHGLRSLGVCRIDTAPVYGDTEPRLGRQDLEGFAIASKFTTPHSETWCGPVLGGVTTSSCDLGRDGLDLVQWHNWRRELLSDPRAARVLIALRESGVAAEVGATTYGAADAVAAVRSGLFDQVQIEWSLLNRGVLRALAGIGRHRTRIAVRSVLLQGLLAGRPLPPHLAALRPALQRCREIAAAQGCSCAELAVRAALDEPGIDLVVIGIDGPTQLVSLARSLRCGSLDAEVRQELLDCDCSDLPAVDPRTWAAA